MAGMLSFSIVALSLVLPATLGMSVFGATASGSVAFGPATGRVSVAYGYPGHSGGVGSANLSSGVPSVSSSDVGSQAGSSSPDGSWQVVSRYPSQIGAINSVSCPSAAICVAVGSNYAYAGVAIYTTNGGLSWQSGTVPVGTSVLEGVSCGSIAVCVAISSSSSTGASTGSVAPMLLTTSDGGQVWQDAALPPGVQHLSSVSCPTASDCVAVGAVSSTGGSGGQSASVAGTVVTTDGGTSWSLHEASIGLVYFQAVSCFSASYCMAVGDTSINGTTGSATFVSTDGGSSWAIAGIPAGTFNRLIYSLSCPSAQACVGVGSQLSTSGAPVVPLIVATTDGGATWITQTPPAGLTGIGALTSVTCPSPSVCLAVSPGSSPYGSGASTPYVIGTTSGGSTWVSESPPPRAGSLDSISCPTASICTAVGAVTWNTSIPVLLQTADGGTTWATKSVPAGIAELAAMSCSSESNCTAVGYDAAKTSAYIEATSDGGRNWTQQAAPPSPMSLEGVSCPSSTHCTAVGDNHTDSLSYAASTSNAGLTWTAGTIPSGPHSMEGVSCLSTVECVAVGFEQGESQAYLYRTTDGGITWNMSAAPPADVSGNSVVIGALESVSCAGTSQCVAVGFNESHTDGFAVYSSDGGSTWHAGMMPLDTSLLAGVSCSTAVNCVAVGEQAVVTTDGGALWTALKYPRNAVFLDSVSCSTPSYCSVVGVDSAGGPMAAGTTDGGSTWVNEPLPSDVTAIYSIACPSGSEFCYATGATTNDQVILEKPVPAPTISFITPDSSPLTGGASVVITGTYLLSATAVTFGPAGNASAVTEISANEVTATVPSYSTPGVVGVTVTTPYGTSIPAGFVYVMPDLSYFPIQPFREADTRCSSTSPTLPAVICTSEHLPLANGGLDPPSAGGSIQIQVTGTAGTSGGSVPDDAEAVVITLTAVASSSTGNGYLSAYPAGTARPIASSLNYAPGEAVPNLVTVTVGSGGKISIMSSSGSVNVVVDVEGYYAPSGSGGSYFDPLTSSARILDTRCTQTTPPHVLPGYCSTENIPSANADVVAPGSAGIIAVKVTGMDGVPATGVTAVMLNITAAGPPSANGYLTVWPTGTLRTITSNVNFFHNTTSDSVIVATGQGSHAGEVDIYNSSGTSQLIVDVSGWFSSGGYAFTPSSPVRICDTRSVAQIGGTPDVAGGASLQCANSGRPVTGGADGELLAQVIGVGGVPASAVAVTANVTVTFTTANSYLTFFQAGTSMPATSNLNWSVGEIKSNMAVLPLALANGQGGQTAQGGQGGSVDVFNLSGSTAVVIDITGWYAPTIVK